MVASTPLPEQHPADAHRCRRCRRPLTAKRSIARRCGPVCLRRNAIRAVVAA